MKIDKLSFDGTAQEFAGVAHLFATSSVGSVPAPAHDERSAELMVRVITRSALAPNHRGMIQAVVAAGDAGILVSEIAEALQMTPEQFRGVSGSFGRRAAATPGWPEGRFYFDFERDEAANEWRYFLYEPFRSAVAAKL